MVGQKKTVKVTGAYANPVHYAVKVRQQVNYNQSFNLETSTLGSSCSLKSIKLHFLMHKKPPPLVIQTYKQAHLFICMYYKVPSFKQTYSLIKIMGVGLY